MSFVVHLPGIIGANSFRPGLILTAILVYLPLQFADSHPYIEELWGTLCQFWPNNLKVILRYLLIISGMAPNELLAYVSSVFTNPLDLLISPDCNRN